MAWGSQLAAGTASAITQNINSRYDTVRVVADNIEYIIAAAEGEFPPSATHPTTRPNGDPLQPGDIYFNTSTNKYLVWNGDAWVMAAGQSVDNGTKIGYTIGFTAALTAKEDIIVKAGVNGFSIDNLELVNGATLTIEDGAIYKVI